ncbi:MAG: nucleotidyl transferase AbiEii/AbiGii toxin family protein, partial [Pseudomonadota bacterium]
RVSKDIDIFIADPQLLGHLSPRLNPIAEAIAPDYVEQANFLKLYFPEGEIDFVVSRPLTDDPVIMERVLGRDIRVETSAEIIAKKLWYRSSDLTARDIFDFALVAQREPAALRQIQPILADRAETILERIEDWSEALREDFLALDVLDDRPAFDDCIGVIREVLSAGSIRPPQRAEQKRAQYLVLGRSLRVAAAASASS